MNPFRYDSLVMQALTGIGNFILLNLCYIVTCIPIVTIGAATTALYAVFTNKENDDWWIIKFFRAFRRDFRQGTVYGLLVLLGAFLILMSFYCLSTYEVFGESVVYILLYVVCAIVLAVAAYGFALISRYSNTTGRVVKNAFLLAIQTMPFSVIIAVISAAPLLLLMIDGEAFLFSLLFWLAAGFAVSVRLNSFFINRFFKKIELQNASEEETQK